MRRFYLRSLSKSSFDTIDQKARDSSRVFFGFNAACGVFFEGY
jgi:hypothetical protein